MKQHDVNEQRGKTTKLITFIEATTFTQRQSIVIHVYAVVGPANAIRNRALERTSTI
jgi:hypothetical protein